jgi:hypothetical protein
MTTSHWPASDVCGDLLAEALRPGTAEPVAIHLRPALHVLIRRQDPSAAAEPVGGGAAGRLAGIRLVVDDGIPAAPGYEIHRAVPRSRAA